MLRWIRDDGWWGEGAGRSEELPGADEGSGGGTATGPAVFVGLACFTLFFRLFATMAIPGWTSNLLTASFFGAVNALGISILGEYVVRIYDQVRGRPLDLVDRAVNIAPTRGSRSTITSAEKDEAYEQLLRNAQDLVSMAESTPTDAAEQPTNPSDD